MLPVSNSNSLVFALVSAFSLILNITFGKHSLGISQSDKQLIEQIENLTGNF